jgi:hypothetical protein
MTTLISVSPMRSPSELECTLRDRVGQGFPLAGGLRAFVALLWAWTSPQDWKRGPALRNSTLARVQDGKAERRIVLVSRTDGLALG